MTVGLGLRGRVIAAWVISQIVVFSIIAYFSVYQTIAHTERLMLEGATVHLSHLVESVTKGEITEDAAVIAAVNYPHVLRSHLEDENGNEVWQGPAKLSQARHVGIEEIGHPEGLFHATGRIYRLSVPIGAAARRLVAVFVTATPSSIFAQLSKTTILAFLAYVLLTAAGVWWTDRTLQKHIRSFIRATERISGGAVGEVVSIPTHDPLERLAGSFNQMSKQLADKDSELRDLNRTLEQRVNERTAQLRVAHAELLKAEKMAMIGKLAVELAHEIRNPLTGVRYAVELLSQSGVDEEKRRDMIEVSLKGLDRVERMIAALLLLTRQSSAQPRPVSQKLVRLLRVIRQAATETGVIERVTFGSVESADDRALADPDMTNQILCNLFRNAAEVSVNAPIQVNVRRADDGIEVTVQDEGPGVPEPDRELIFEPFYTTKTSGVGLGLAIARHLARAQGGDLRIEPSEKGACLSLMLPAVRTDCP